jgi:hypothetical protein
MEPRLHIPSPHARADKASRLAAMGLTAELLDEGMRYAFSEMERCSGNDVKAAKGNAAYGKPLRFVRERLLPEGWSKGGMPNLESVIHPSRAFQITTSSANWATGDIDLMPATKYLKGRRTAEVIKDNGQMAMDLAGMTKEVKPEMRTFFWLYYLDEGKEEIRHELAIPTHMTIKPKAKRGRIDEFASRIILDAISLDSADIDEERGEEFSDDLDIQIERRAQN